MSGGDACGTRPVVARFHEHDRARSAARDVESAKLAGMAWTPFSVRAPVGLGLSDESVTYGPCIPDEASLRLLGDVSGKRVLDLGCGAGRNAVALARSGARTMAADEDAEQIAQARSAIDTAGVRVELHHVSLAELAFLRADTIDAAISVYALTTVGDIGRVFRQVHRVLRPEHAFVIALPHPMFALINPDNPDGVVLEHSAFDEEPYGEGDPRAGTMARSMSSVFVELHRAGFRVDSVLEPKPSNDGTSHWVPAMTQIPPTLIIRARKEGI